MYELTLKMINVTFIIFLHKYTFVFEEIVSKTTANHMLYQKCACNASIYFNSSQLTLVEWAKSGATRTRGPSVPAPLADTNLQRGVEL